MMSTPQPHKPSDAASREYRLGLMYRELTKFEQAITAAEEREKRMASNSNLSPDLRERFPNLNKQ
jgi:hypothetical protein